MYKNLKMSLKRRIKITEFYECKRKSMRRLLIILVVFISVILVEFIS